MSSQLQYTSMELSGLPPTQFHEALCACTRVCVCGPQPNMACCSLCLPCSSVSGRGLVLPCTSGGPQPPGSGAHVTSEGAERAFSQEHWGLSLPWLCSLKQPTTAVCHHLNTHTAPYTLCTLYHYCEVLQCPLI